jgi:hypothetical protein
MEIYLMYLRRVAASRCVEWLYRYT